MYAAIDVLADKLDRQVLRTRTSATTTQGIDAGPRVRFDVTPAACCHELVSKLLPGRTSCSTSTCEQEAPVRAGGAAVREPARDRAQRGLRQPVRAREARLDRPRPGHRHPARPHQGTRRRRWAPSSALRPAGAVRRARRQAGDAVFVLLVPEQATEQHLQLLSELAQMFSDKALRESHEPGARRGGPAPARHSLAAGCCRSASRGCMTISARRWRSPG